MNPYRMPGARDKEKRSLWSTIFVGVAVLAFLFVASGMLLTACGAALTSQDKSELLEFKAQMSACLAAHPSNKAAQDQCMNQVRDDWYKQWNARFDGGFE